MRRAALEGRIVLDASVLVEMLGEFRYPHQARFVLETFAAEPRLELWAPDLIYPESLSALRRLVAEEALADDDVARAIDLVLDLPLEIATTAPLLKDAWSLRGHLTAYDACYVALARNLDGSLITADARLHRTLTRRRERSIYLGDVAH